MGVPEDSKFPLLGVWASPSHLAQSGVATTWLVLAIVDNVEVEVVDEPIIEVSTQHFVIGLNIAMWVVVVVVFIV